MVPAAVHVALLKRWQEAYGAEVVVVLPDLLELQVLHPPATRAAAYRARLGTVHLLPGYCHPGHANSE